MLQPSPEGEFYIYIHPGYVMVLLITTHYTATSVKVIINSYCLSMDPRTSTDFLKKKLYNMDYNIHID